MEGVAIFSSLLLAGDIALKISDARDLAAIAPTSCVFFLVPASGSTSTFRFFFEGSRLIFSSGIYLQFILPLLLQS